MAFLKWMMGYVPDDSKISMFIYHSKFNLTEFLG